MPSSATTRTARNSVLITVCIVVVLALASAAIYLRRPVNKPAEGGHASAEARAYLPNLRLSDVTMQATDNFMKQQVVEVQGKITNKGPVTLKRVEVYCVFYGMDNREIHREPLAIVSPSGPLNPGQTRAFRLPFDTVPEGWNQVIPSLVIAQIDFAK